MTLAGFEALVQAQRPAAQAWEPVTDYSFEGRRAAEGAHPQLILDVFCPESICDVGCGFNYLARLVNEIAGRRVAFGCDVSNQAADFQMDITRDRSGVPSWELVICREVLEHLTVLQIRQAVTNLCGLSLRFVYVTTRFHQQPSSLLDVATSDDLDPTHISMLHQDFLRVLFVLEGFARRTDLEQRIDWMQKGRVLVYERA